jgi:hypothetical protein
MKEEFTKFQTIVTDILLKLTRKDCFPIELIIIALLFSQHKLKEWLKKKIMPKLDERDP